jgi:hypothetical protein
VPANASHPPPGCRPAAGLYGRRTVCAVAVTVLVALAAICSGGSKLRAGTMAARCAELCSTHQDQPALAGSR